MDRFTIPEVRDAEPIVGMVARLRKDIVSECAELLRRARKANADSRGAASYRVRRWEGRINRILEANATTFSIGELRRLRKECTALSDELGRLGK